MVKSSSLSVDDNTQWQNRDLGATKPSQYRDIDLVGSDSRVLLFLLSFLILIANSIAYFIFNLFSPLYPHQLGVLYLTSVDLVLHLMALFPTKPTHHCRNLEVPWDGSSMEADFRVLIKFVQSKRSERDRFGMGCRLAGRLSRDWPTCVMRKCWGWGFMWLSLNTTSCQMYVYLLTWLTWGFN